MEAMGVDTIATTLLLQVSVNTTPKKQAKEDANHSSCLL